MKRSEIPPPEEFRPSTDPMQVVEANSPVPLYKTVFKAHPAGFGKDYQLIEAYDSNWLDDWRLFMLADKDGQLYHLNGTSMPIHAFWETHALSLTPKTAPNYLRFFCRFIHGPEGSFYITESASELALWCGVDEDHPSIKEVSKYIKKIKFKSTGADHLIYKATVHYSDALFRATFKVMPTGMIEMLDDKPKAQNIGIREKCRLVTA